jgi:hypothetical protein
MNAWPKGFIILHGYRWGAVMDRCSMRLQGMYEQAYIEAGPSKTISIRDDTAQIASS